MRVFSVAMALVCLAACGGDSDSGSATVSGTAGGITLSNVSEAISLVASNVSCGTGDTASGIIVEISSRAGQCAAAQANETLANSTTLLLEILTAGSTPVATGVYTIDGETVIADLVEFGSTCSTGSAAEAASGTITITSINGNAVSGSFSLQMEAAGGSGTSPVTGSFSTGGCSITSAELCADLSSDDSPTCSP